MDWKDRIEVNPAVLVGKPIIKGTRISVELILDRLADGWSMEDVLASYPHIRRVLRKNNTHFYHRMIPHKKHHRQEY